jgi:very-short-patch-repair endonuclease
MRREPTYAGQELWRRLRQTGCHLRRQAPFGPDIVDFVCHRHGLIVEIDGPVHDLPGSAERDAERQAWLTGRGYRVMRFRDSVGIDAMMEQILSALDEDTPTPSLSPQGGGELMEPT